VVATDGLTQGLDLAIGTAVDGVVAATGYKLAMDTADWSKLASGESTTKVADALAAYKTW